VQSHLIAAQLHDDAQSTKEAFADKGWVFFTTWDDLIERAKQGHVQFREILQKKAKETDESPTTEVESDGAPTRKQRNTAKKRSPAGKTKKRTRR
jgi:hypothetical protein